MRELLSGQGLLSGRVKKTPPTKVSDDRYQWLSLQEAEPDLGIPDVEGAVLFSSLNGTRQWSSSLVVDQEGNLSLGTITDGVWQGTPIAVEHGGTGASTQSDARTNLGATSAGSNLFTLTNPSANTYLKINADNTVSTLSAKDFKLSVDAESEYVVLISTTDLTAIDSWSEALYRSGKYIVQVTQGTSYQVSEILIIHDGANTFMTEYAVVQTTGTALASFTSDVVGGNVRILVTMTSADSATIKMNRTIITI